MRVADRDQIQFRNARPDDLDATYWVYAAATSELMKRHGFSRAIPPRVPPPALAFRRHALAQDPAGFWVAEDAERVVGACIALRRDSLWYLAELHVLPGLQGRGIGRRLLELGLSTRQTHDCLAVTANSIQPVSSAMYIAAGMLPWLPILQWEGPLPPALPPRSPKGDLRAAVDAEELSQLDDVILGWRKTRDHSFMQSRQDLECGVLFHSGQPAGYAYVSKTGKIGPVAMLQEEFAEPLVYWAIERLQAGKAKRMAVSVPGSAPVVQDVMHRLALRLTGPSSMLLASRALWRPGTYLAAGGDAPL